MAKVTIFVGLPGSGKSYYLNKMVEDGLVEEAYMTEDFHAHAKNDSSLVLDSKDYEALMSALEQDKDYALADIAFTENYRLKALTEEIGGEFPNAAIDIRYFENDPDACRANVLRDKNRKTDGRLAEIEKRTKTYKIPDSVVPIKIYRD